MGRDKSPSKAPPRPLAKPLIAGLLATLGLLLGVEVIRTAGAEAFAARNPDFALLLQPSHPNALMEKVRRRLNANPSPKTLRDMEALALRATRGSMIDVRTYRTLGLAAEARGEEEEARALMAIAASMSWRDDATSLWMLSHALEVGDYASALSQADALLRQGNSQRQPLLGVITDIFMSAPEGAELLVGHLASAPTWRWEFLAGAFDRPEGAARAYSLMLALQDSASPVTNSELELLLDRLVTAKQFDQAYLAWLLLSPANEPVGSGFIFDPGFSRIPGARPFNWSLGQGPGATVAIDRPTRDSTDTVLSVHYSGLLSLTLARQLLLLPPGDYRLEGAERTMGDGSRLSWTITCADTGDVLARQTAQTTEWEWKKFSLDFQMPASCPAQWLMLEISQSDRPAAVDAAFNDLDIQLVSGS